MSVEQVASLYFAVCFLFFYKKKKTFFKTVLSNTKCGNSISFWMDIGFRDSRLPRYAQYSLKKNKKELEGQAVDEVIGRHSHKKKIKKNKNNWILLSYPDLKSTRIGPVESWWRKEVQFSYNTWPCSTQMLDNNNSLSQNMDGMDVSGADCMVISIQFSQAPWHGKRFKFGKNLPVVATMADKYKNNEHTRCFIRSLKHIANNRPRFLSQNDSIAWSGTLSTAFTSLQSIRPWRHDANWLTENWWSQHVLSVLIGVASLLIFLDDI